ncbi:Phage-related minor tail protein [Magnetospirillum sp. LM-5]|uniref:phage tail tape measure C-terminal domain-containing protein n=1 Tax=Magnetospirillum sp. LM-5 TaxID=2681466 RepID=UPI0013808E3C|nr:phage tail tape measure C-terminal domain-containing protein [Magnetospirillum sp. LM-5]CAA7618968.1 Phage-related minor tail protein [Magnetospirillum sp. LM-5]
MTAARTVSIRLALEDGEVFRRALMQLGEDGRRALERIERAAQPASKALLAINEVGQGVRGVVEGMAGRMGLFGDALMATGRTGLIAAAAVGAVGAALVQGVREMESADQSLRRLEAVLKATGAASGLTAGQLAALADEMETGTLATAEGVMDASAVMATFRSVSGDTFTRAIRLAQDLSAVFRQDLSSSATQLGKALEDPIEGISALKRVGVSFSATQKEVIRTLVETGDVAGAQRIVLDALEQQVGGAGAAEAAGLTGAAHHLAAAWGNLLEEIARTSTVGRGAQGVLHDLTGMVDGIRDLLKGPDIAAGVAAKSRQLVEVEGRIAEYQGIGVTGRRMAELRRQADLLRRDIDTLVEKGRTEVAAFEAERDQAESGRQAAERDRNAEAMSVRLKALEEEKVKAATDAAGKIAAIETQLARDIEGARKKAPLPGVDAGDVDREIALLRQVAARKVEAIEKPLAEARLRAAEQTAKVLDDLQRELSAPWQPRQAAIDPSVSRLPKEASATDRAEAARLAGDLFDQKQALDELQRALKEEADARARGKELVRQHRTAEQEYADTLRDLNDLLAQGALDADSHARAIEAAEKRKLAASREWSDGAKRALAAYVEDSSDAARGAKRAVTGMLKSSEDAFVKWATTGKLAAGDLFNTLAEEALRAAWRMAVVAPLFGGASGGLFGGLIAGIGSFFSGTGSAGPSGGGSVPVPSTGNFAIAHTGGLIGLDRLDTRAFSPSVFANAPKFHGGGLVAGERPIVARVGEGVFTPRQMDNADRILNTALSQPAAVGVVVTVNNNASGTQARAEQSQGPDGRIHLDIIVEEIEGRMSRRIGRGEGMAPVLEHRYGLNPAAGAYR